MTIHQLAALNKENNGHWFDADTMKCFGETMKSFSIKNNKVEKTVTLTKKRDGTTAVFSSETGRVIH